MQRTRLISFTYTDEMGMRASARNWEYGTLYFLKPQAVQGTHDTLLLPRMQLSFTNSSGGQFRAVTSPKGTISVAAVLESNGKGCFGCLKFKAGDIVIFDDSKEQLFFTSENHRIAIVSFPKNTFRKLARTYAPFCNNIIENAADSFGGLLESVFQRVKETPEQWEDKNFLTQQEKIVHDALSRLLDFNLPYFPKLTRGEKIALEIRDRVYDHIEPDIAINNFAKEYGVTEQTLQNAFKSLFGMTPHRFLRNLKLNHVKKELLQADPKKTTIVAIANKWGFTHMGHFSGYYTRLFGENPSATLQRGHTAEDTRKPMRA